MQSRLIAAGARHPLAGGVQGLSGLLLLALLLPALLLLALLLPALLLPALLLLALLFLGVSRSLGLLLALARALLFARGRLGFPAVLFLLSVKVPRGGQRALHVVLVFPLEGLRYLALGLTYLPSRLAGGFTGLAAAALFGLLSGAVEVFGSLLHLLGGALTQVRIFSGLFAQALRALARLLGQFAGLPAAAVF